MRVVITGASRGIGRAAALSSPPTAPGAHLCDVAYLDELEALATNLRDLGLQGAHAQGRHGPAPGARHGHRRRRQGDGRHRCHRRQCRHHRARQAGRSRYRAWDRIFNINLGPTGFWPRRRIRISSDRRAPSSCWPRWRGVMPQIPTGAYSPAKAALVMLTEMLAMEWASDGIRANSVCPGFVHTSMTDAIYRQSKLARGRAGWCRSAGSPRRATSPTPSPSC